LTRLTGEDTHKKEADEFSFLFFVVCFLCQNDKRHVFIVDTSEIKEIGGDKEKKYTFERKIPK